MGWWGRERGGGGGWNIQNFLISSGLELAQADRWNFCNYLVNAGGVVAIPKQRMGNRSGNFE